MSTPSTEQRGAAPCEPTTPSQSDKGVWIPRLLIIDHDDSYTLNILVTLLQALCLDGEATRKDEQQQQHAHSTAEAESSRTERLASVLLSRTLIVRHTDPLLASPAHVQAQVLPHFDAVIISPGPGRADVAGDFDAAARFLKMFTTTQDGAPATEILVPTLGLCLGHQGIAAAFGGKIKRAAHLRHGLASTIHVTSEGTPCRLPSLFAGMEHQHLDMTTYNSLVVDEQSLPPTLQVTAVAYDVSPSQTEVAHGRSQDVERVVMAIQHIDQPLWGIQFHPESIESRHGAKVMRNFLDNVTNYWGQHHQGSASEAMRIKSWDECEALPHWLREHCSRRSGHERDVMSLPLLRALRSQCAPQLQVSSRKLGQLPASLAANIFAKVFAQDENAPAVWLDSARPGGPHSRFSYMASPSWMLQYDVCSKTVRVEHNERHSIIDIGRGAEHGTKKAHFDERHGLATPLDSRAPSPTDHHSMQAHGFWSWFDAIQKALQQRQGTPLAEHDHIPFQGGFVGYFGYEMKSESIPVRTTNTTSAGSDPNGAGSGSHALPTATFGFCDKVLVLDHESDEWTAVGLVGIPHGDNTKDHTEGPFAQLEEALEASGGSLGITQAAFQEWTAIISDALAETTGCSTAPALTSEGLPSLAPLDPQHEYVSKVESARDLIAQGQSYELCLTTEFRGRLAENNDESTAAAHLRLYNHLRGRNPAPYSAFFKLDGTRSILSTSPEKFMSIDASSQLVEMKPIKGTSARAGHGKEPQEAWQSRRASLGNVEALQRCIRLDEERRQALQTDAKERAENLMIVDLIRRDMLAFCSPETVTVPRLMAIETYETVHQLVTTVQGRKASTTGPIEAVARCFPPGSMTGAPKVRSVELLEKLEGESGQYRRSQGQEEDVPFQRTGRGVYSGVLGWIGLNGSSCFNVLIRTVVMDGRDISVGAGGAITYLSSAEREWQEVLEKVGSIADVDLREG